MKRPNSFFRLLVILSFILSFSEPEGTKLKFIRYSGKLLGIHLEGDSPYFEMREESTGKPRKIHCDRDTLQNLKGLFLQNADLDIDGKASAPLDGKSLFSCEGKPNTGKRYRVGISESVSSRTKWIEGQIVEADPSTGQVVYIGAGGRRGYITVSPLDAERFRSRLDQLETIEIRGNYRYDRIRRYFIEE